MARVELPLEGGWVLRDWRLEDAAAVARYANNRNVWRNLRDAFPHPYTYSDARAWVRSRQGQSPVTDFAIAGPHEAIGAIGLHPQDDVYRRSAEVGYWLGEPFWGRGIATMAVRAISHYAFATFDLVRLYAGVFQWDPASARVLEKAGYRLECRQRKAATKDGHTIDVLMYVLLRGNG